jgi:uncharacterized protein (TIGR01244 family)
MDDPFPVERRGAMGAHGDARGVHYIQLKYASAKVSCFERCPMSDVRLVLPLLLVALLGHGAALASIEGLPDIPNAVQPADHLLIGGQPDEAALRAAAAAGIQVVVNLRGESETIDFDEAQLVNQLGMTYVQLPISGASDLTPENVQAFDQLLESIGNQPTLMHCGSGNRVGALYALRAGAAGADVETALEHGRAHGLTGLEDEVRQRLESAPEE